MNRRRNLKPLQRTLRTLAGLGSVALVTFVGARVVPVNAATIGFAYLLTVLIIAATWGFGEALVCAVAATLGYNYFFLPPVGTWTIADPQNWIALFAFLASALIASRLSAQARRRAVEAIASRQEVERLYTFSRAILLSSRDEPFPTQLVRHLAAAFELDAVVLYHRRDGRFYRAGAADFEGLDDQLREVALHGAPIANLGASRTINAIRLGSEPIGSLALQGPGMPDSVLQGIANLVAIGLERAAAQELAHQVEAARQSERLRTTLIDAMAHEFKTPLTLVKGATSSVLSGGHPLSPEAREQLTIADEEAEHLRELIDNAIEMARLDTTHIDVRLEISGIEAIVREVVVSMKSEIDGRPVEVSADPGLRPVPVDRRLVRLALKQLLDNALKYSPSGTPVVIRVGGNGENVYVDVANQGAAIPPEDLARIFDRFYRAERIRNQIPGSGLGLTIASSIARAHRGELTVSSRLGETTFRLSLPYEPPGGPNP